MAALAASRLTNRLNGTRIPLLLAGTVFQGGMAAVDANGKGVAASALATQRTVGVYDRDGVALDVVNAEREIFALANSAPGVDEITIADIGRPCFVVDDQTVAKTSNGGLRPVAGLVHDVNEYGVWVDFRDDQPLRKIWVPATVETLVGTGLYFAIAPIAGKVTRVGSITEDVLTTGNATLTSKINGTNITTGVITIAQAGSAAGDYDEAVPTAANAVAAGDKLSVLVGGTNATATKARVLFEITY